MYYEEMEEGQSTKADLAMSLGVTLSSAYVFLIKVAGFHWNVKGPDFAEYHELFGEIYEDIDSMIDPCAENILKLGYDAPASFAEFRSMSEVEDGYTGENDPIQMCNALLAANESLIAQINETFNIANEENEQGIADFMASRDDMHKMWQWQLRAVTGAQTGGELGKSDADHSEEPTAPAVENDRQISPCPMCEVECECDGQICVCPPQCTCDCKMIVAAASRKAPKKDRIYGSKKNAPGSASGGKKITFSAKTEKALRNKMQEHNEKAPKGRRATMSQLKAAYRRGAGAYSSSHRPGKTRDQWAMARVNAYLRLLRTGTPANPNYKQDNDLLPSAHPKSTRASASLIASGVLDVEILEESAYENTEEAILAMAEFSDLSYDAIPALRAAWLRAVDSNENPFERAKNLAENLYNSSDADLLPKRN
jgi:starvation-inducible DNA-binding protein